jgi:thiol-disulfide isomerase/thioredoxin
MNRSVAMFLGMLFLAAVGSLVVRWLLAEHGGVDAEAGFAHLLGKPAPALKADHVLGGGPDSLADLKGKVVLLDFWAVWCGPCVSTFPHLKRWHQEFGPKGLEIVGATTYFKTFDFDPTTGRTRPSATPLTQDQENAMLAKFATFHQLPYRLWVLNRESYLQATADYGVEGIPHVVLIDREGMIRYVRVGAGEDAKAATESKLRELLR